MKELAILAFILLIGGSRPAISEKYSPAVGKIMSKNASFDAQLEGISKRTGIPYNWLILHLNAESGLDTTSHVNYAYDPKIKKKRFYYGLTGLSSVNETTIGGGLFGLMKKFCKPPIYDGSFFDFMREPASVQLAAFERSIEKRAKKIKSYPDMRLAGFAPAYLGKPDSTVVYADDPENPRDAYSANAWLDLDKDGKITIAELKQKWVADWNRMSAKYNKRGTLRP